MDGWTYRCAYKYGEFFPILQDFIPYWGRCPKKLTDGPTGGQTNRLFDVECFIGELGTSQLGLKRLFSF